MIHVIATIRCQPDQREQVLAHITDNLPAVRAEDGCIQYQPCIDLDTDIAAQAASDPATIVMIETWESEAHLQAHLEAPHMRRFRERVSDLVMSVDLRILTPT